VSPHHPTRGLGSIVSSPGGVWGGTPSPGRKWILCIFEVSKKPSGTPFSVFLSDGGLGGPPKRHGAQENFPPSPPPLDGPGDQDWKFKTLVAKIK